MLADSSLTSGGGVWMAIAMLCAVSLILTQIRRAHARRPGREQFVQQQMDRLSDAREMRHSCDDMVVRLEDTSRRICAEIDTRFAQLECAVAEARARAAQLEALLAELRESGVAAPPPVSFDPAGHDAAARGPGDGVRAERGPVDGSRVCSGPADGRRGRTGVDDEPPSASVSRCSGDARRSGPLGSDRLDSGPLDSGPLESGPPLASEELLDVPADQAARTDALRQRVYALADAGRRNIHIARELELPLGEVELILNLRQFE